MLRSTISEFIIEAQFKFNLFLLYKQQEKMCQKIFNPNTIARKKKLKDLEGKVHKTNEFHKNHFQNKS